MSIEAVFTIVFFGGLTIVTIIAYYINKRSIENKERGAVNKGTNTKAKDVSIKTPKIKSKKKSNWKWWLFGLTALATVFNNLIRPVTTPIPSSPNIPQFIGNLLLGGGIMFALGFFIDYARESSWQKQERRDGERQITDSPDRELVEIDNKQYEVKKQPQQETSAQTNQQSIKISGEVVEIDGKYYVVKKFEDENE